MRQASSPAGQGHAPLLPPSTEERALRTQLLLRTLRQQMARVVSERRRDEATARRSGPRTIRKK
jgi:hypothetical protein